ncbi:BapA/Bap/LapF family large adhesin, partial [Acinetobacter tianfuensis]
DKAGNIGTGTDVLDDKVAPVVTVDVTPNADGTATVTGKTEPGATVTVKDPSGNTVPVTVNPDGSYTATVPAPATEGVYTATATDKAGNIGTGTDALDDNISPSVSLSFNVNGELVINFSEPVKGFDISDVDMLGGTLTNFVQVSPTQWTALIKANGNAATQYVEVSILDGKYTDTAGNTGMGASAKGDITLPTVEIDPFDFFAAAPAAEPMMKFARTALASEPLPPATNNPKQTFNGSSMNSVEVKINIYDSSNNLVESGLATLNLSTGRWSYTPSKPLADGQFRLEAISKDAYGATSAPANIKFIIDTVKPTVDIDDAGAVNDATPSFSGKTEANAAVTVTVKDASGKVLATGAAVVAADGSWTYTAPNLADGTYTVEAVAKDRAGNLSAPDSTSVTVDTVAQLDALTVTANSDGTATVTGKAEPGATVTVKDPNGNDLTVTVNADGTFSAVAPAPAAEGTYTAAATDAVGNKASASADLDDQVAPVIVGLDVVPNPDGTATVTGKTEPGSTVTLKDPNGQNIPVTVNPDGTFTAAVPAPAPEGAYTATATDPAGNSGTATDVLDDNLAPAITVDLVSNADGTATVTGKTEPGATVTLKDPNGKDIPVTVNPDGSYTATVPATAADGTYTAAATDKAGNTGKATDELADTSVPSILTAQVDPQTGGFVTGTAQPGSAVTVYKEDGKTVLGTGTADASGKYSVTLQPAQVDGENVKVTAKDPGGESAPITAAAPDLYAPDAPTAQVAADGKSVSGVTEPNAIVQIYGGSKGTTVIGTAVAGADGKYTAPLNPALVDGETVKVTAKDAGGESLATPAQAPDLYAPNAPTAAFDSTGNTISGDAEANSVIKIYAPNGTILIAQGTSDANGKYSIKLPSAYTDAQTLLVSASDGGGESGKTGAKAPDVKVDAVDNLVDAGINFEYPVTAVRTSKLFSESSILNIGSKTYSGTFSVGEGEVGNATITVNTGSLINLFDQAVMKLYKVNADGSKTLLGSNKDAGLFDLLGIFGEGTQVKVNNLSSGKYVFEFTGGSALGAFTSTTANLSLQVTDTSKDPVVSGVTEKSGNVVTDADGVYGKDAVPAGTTVTAVNGQALNAAGTTTIVGDHGTLTIAKDGSYTYKPNANVANIGKSEVFSYTVTDPATGKTDTANLIIHIGTQSDLAVKWNDADPKVDATTVAATDNVDTIGLQASNAISAGATKSISYNWGFGLGGSKAGSTDIVVAKDTIENLNISFGSTQLISLLGSTTINIRDKVTGKLIATTASSTLVDVIGILPNGNSLSVSGLKAGSYVIESVTNKGVSLFGSVNATITRSVIDLNDFTVTSGSAQTKGNLITDNDGHGTDVLASKYTDLYISNDGGLTYKAVTSTGITVAGKHGNLTVKSDGSYTYTAADGKAAAGAFEDFSYKLVAPNGDESVAHLTINSGLVYNTSNGADVITSSGGNDTYTTNGGADTVIFKLLNTAEATGGNGHDTWTDFKKTDGDKIDISALLQGQTVDKSNIANFVSVEKDGHGNTIISIDRDGSNHTSYAKTELLTLKNTDVTLQELLDNNHLIF